MGECQNERSQREPVPAPVMGPGYHVADVDALIDRIEATWAGWPGQVKRQCHLA